MLRMTSSVILCAITLWAVPSFAQESSYLTSARDAAKAAPRDAAAQIALGEALVEARLLKEARRVFNTASRLSSGRAGATYGLAKIEMAQDDIPGARRVCQRLVKVSRESPLGHVCEGNAFLAWSRASRAVEGFEKALKMDSNNAEALIGMGDVNRAQGNVSKAEDFYRKALKAAPGKAAAHLGLGLLYRSRDRMDEARRELRSATKAEPGLAEPHHHLGILLGKTPEAVAELRRAVEIRPGWGQGLEALGQTLAGRGEHAEAVKVLSQATVANPNLAGAHHYLGLSQWALKQLPQAEASLRQAVKLVPSLSDAVISLGDVLAEQGLHDDALEVYQEAATLSPSDGRVAVHTGNLYRLLSRNTLARAQFQRARQLDPNLAAAAVALGDIYFELEEWEDARTFYEASTQCTNQEGVNQAHLRQRLEQLRRQ